MFKRLGLIILFSLFLQGATSNAQNATTSQAQDRKTSTPYKGDLSISIHREETKDFRSTG